MPPARQLIGRLLLNLPVGLRSFRNVPLLGRIAHRLSYSVVPADEKVWACVQRGPGAGLWIELNPRTGLHYLRGEVEPATQHVLAENLKPGMVFYDLGANIGFFSLLASRLVGESGRVFSFEPDPEVASRLRRNVERNAFRNVTVLEAGIWSTSGLVNFIASTDSSPDRGVGRFVTEEGGAVGTPTRCIQLDKFVETSPPPDVIKCDIEGAEVDAFRGAQNLLARQHPTIICEIHSEHSSRQLRHHLAECGYYVTLVDDLHVLAVSQVVKK